MVEILETGAENVVGCKIDGRIEKSDIEKIILHVEEKLKDNPKLRIYVELEKLGMMTPEALFKDIKFAIDHFSDFEKKAIVTDKEWVAKLTPVFSKIFPGIELKCFEFEKKDEALEWAKS